MSAPAPQVLSRRAHHGPPPPEPPAKGKSTHDSHPQRPSRGAPPPGEKAQDAVKSEPSKRTKTRPLSQGEKLVIRRLPPGMTEAEAVSILGIDWEVNKGKVDWFSFCPGKASVDPSKPSRPGRAYLHLVRKDDMMALSQVVRSATWEDAKSTFTSPSLVGPPNLEFATYKKIPSTRRRVDPRQGTIDQDPEFMAFLEGLANPVPFRESIDADEAEDGSKEEGKITTTPLVEFLKEKKANKGKDSGKNAKTGPAKGKGSDDPPKKKTRDTKTDKTAAKEPVKILTKKATTEPAPEVVASPVSAADGAKGRRAGIAAAARILQRDLGLSPGSAHRRARHDAAKAEAATSKESTASANEAVQPSSTTPTTTTTTATTTTTTTTTTREAAASSPKSPQPPPSRRVRSGRAAERGKAVESQPMTTPVILRKRGDDEIPLPTTAVRPLASKPAANGKPTTATSANNTANKAKAPAAQKKAPAVTAGATRAFVKHVNASQGVTEAVLRQALEAFGTVTLVEVDKRKGFAYVDFAHHDGLVKAVGAGLVQVAQSAVQVVERREKKVPAAGTLAPEKGPGRGRRGRGGGGGGKATNGTANGPTPAVVASTGGSG